MVQLETPVPPSVHFWLESSSSWLCSLTHIVAKGLNHELAKGQILFQCTNLALPKEFAREVPDV